MTAEAACVRAVPGDVRRCRCPSAFAPAGNQGEKWMDQPSPSPVCFALASATSTSNCIFSPVFTFVCSFPH